MFSGLLASNPILSTALTTDWLIPTAILLVISYALTHVSDGSTPSTLVLPTSLSNGRKYEITILASGRTSEGIRWSLYAIARSWGNMGDPASAKPTMGSLQMLPTLFSEQKCSMDAEMVSRITSLQVSASMLSSEHTHIGELLGKVVVCNVIETVLGQCLLLRLLLHGQHGLDLVHPELVLESGV